MDQVKRGMSAQKIVKCNLLKTFLVPLGYYLVPFLMQNPYVQINQKIWRIQFNRKDNSEGAGESVWKFDKDGTDDFRWDFINNYSTPFNQILCIK